MICLLDARSGQNVMELVEQHVLPGLVETLGRGQPDPTACRRAELLGGGESVLGLAVPALHAGVRRVAAGGVVLEFIVHHRNGYRARLNFREIALRRANSQLGQIATLLLHLVDLVDLLDGRAAAMIADAVEGHQPVQRLF